MVGHNSRHPANGHAEGCSHDDEQTGAELDVQVRRPEVVRDADEAPCCGAAEDHAETLEMPQQLVQRNSAVFFTRG